MRSLGERESAYVLRDDVEALIFHVVVQGQSDD